jgi:dipeptidyl-peptidase 4
MASPSSSRFLVLRMTFPMMQRMNSCAVDDRRAMPMQSSGVAGDRSAAPQCRHRQRQHLGQRRCVWLVVLSAVAGLCASSSRITATDGEPESRPAPPIAVAAATTPISDAAARQRVDRWRSQLNRERIALQWAPNGERAWYCVALGEGRHEFVAVDAPAGTRRALFDHQQAATQLHRDGAPALDPARLPISGWTWSEDSATLTANARQFRLTVDWSRGELTVTPRQTDPLEAAAVWQREIGPTATNGPEFELSLINETDQRVECLWWPPNGPPRSYGWLLPGQTRQQHTFAGHVWLLRSEKKIVVGAFIASEAVPEVRVTESVVATPPVVRGSKSHPQAAPFHRAPADTADAHDTTAAAEVDADVDAAAEAERRREVNNPLGTRAIFLRDHNLWCRELRPKQDPAEHTTDRREGATDLNEAADRTAPDSSEWQLTFDGRAGDAYELDGHWSPDGRWFVARQVEQPPFQRQVQIVEAAPEDQLQPRLLTIPYSKPGDPLPRPKLRLIEIANADGTPQSNSKVSHITPLTETACPHPWSLTHITWWDDSRGFWFVDNERGHQTLRVWHVDVADRILQLAVDERSPTFIDYNGKFVCQVLPGTRSWIWMSERDGWCHLYRIWADGSQPPQQLTRGEWVVRSVEHIDPQQQEIWFSAGGRVTGQDPYFEHLVRIRWDGTEQTVLTEGDGNHEWSFSPDRRWFVDTWSRVDQPPQHVLRDSRTGQAVCILEQASDTGLKSLGWSAPTPFQAPGRDGHTPIYGVIFRPSSFQPGLRYPVIEKIYAGPHAAFVPKSFGLPADVLSLTERGFIVVQIDGMGTSHRSKAFHDVCWKNLKDAGFPDRRAWLQAAAKTLPELDLDRVGIFGGSAGGQSALAALLHHGDFYRAAVADCGCHDNRIDKIWWNELWMGYPIGPEYADNSNVTHAHRLQGAFMLVVGEVDTNVDPASTMQVAKALVAADKDFDLLVMPSVGHGAAETPYASRRRSDFFVRHLGPPQPNEPSGPPSE